MDKIKIENLEIFANHGVYPEETRLGQKFLVSCALHLDTRKAGLTDSLEDSVNYGTICHLIKEQMEKNTFKLIEAAAENLAETILESDARIRQADLEIKKPWAPIGLPLDTASIQISRKWHEAYVAVGSNMGDKKRYIETALVGLANTKGCRVMKVSSLIVTEPYGGVAQDEFLNGAVKIETRLTPHELLDVLHKLEREAGRERKIHWGPRTLDLDILLYDNEIIEDDDLCVPHADMHNRTFVLEPMAEIAPYKRHPVTEKTMCQMLEELLAKSS
ncbi:MAG: 2-amino-4-hydroxy-6-hydroxymethyldihydropteridine diphosphokinase [Bariatricus sp.]|nr:2-amino-4-hydroxy-6-hydroxymethyldihydropteridine diphosphokinase [Bariatricus sp.]